MRGGLVVLLMGVAAASGVYLYGASQRPPAPAEHLAVLPTEFYRLFPDADSSVEIMVDKGSFELWMWATTWLDEACPHKRFILAIRGVDRAICDAQLDPTKRLLPRHRYPASCQAHTVDVPPELAVSREAFTFAVEAWVERRCNDGDSGVDSETHGIGGVARRSHYQRARVLVPPTEDSTGRADRDGGL